MKIKKNILILGTLLTCCAYAFAQKTPELTYKKTLAANKGDSLLVAKQFLKAAKENSDNLRMAEAYKAIIHLSPRELQLSYADSLVQAAVRTGSSYEIGAAYVTQGVLYNSRKNMGKALDNYLIADLYIRAQGDEDLKYKHKYTIAGIKHNLGYYDESISMFKECIAYFEKENDVAYIKSLHFLSLSYQKNGQYSLSKKTVEQGIKHSLDLKINYMIPYFFQVFAVNKYFDGDYKSTYVILKNVLPIFLKNKDIGTTATSNYYAGKSLWNIGKKKDAIPYLKAVDSIFSYNQYITPELRSSYEMLVDYYDEEQDLKKVSRFAAKLIVAENTINRDFKYLATNLHKKYDVKAMRQKILENEKHYFFWEKFIKLLLTALIFPSLIGIFYSVKYLLKKYRSDTKKHDDTSLNSVNCVSDKIKSDKADYPSEATEIKILKSVNKAIDEFTLFNKNLGLRDFAKEIKFSKRQVSRVINNEMKINYSKLCHVTKCEKVLMLIRKNPSHYSESRNKELAGLCGYIDDRAFIDGMKKAFGLTPKQFLKVYMNFISMPECDILTIKELVKKVQNESPSFVRKIGR